MTNIKVNSLSRMDKIYINSNQLISDYKGRSVIFKKDQMFIVRMINKQFIGLEITDDKSQWPEGKPSFKIAEYTIKRYFSTQPNEKVEKPKSYKYVQKYPKGSLITIGKYECRVSTFPHTKTYFLDIYADKNDKIFKQFGFTKETLLGAIGYPFVNKPSGDFPTVDAETLDKLIDFLKECSSDVMSDNLTNRYIKVINPFSSIYKFNRGDILKVLVDAGSKLHVENFKGDQMICHRSRFHYKSRFDSFDIELLPEDYKPDSESIIEPKLVTGWKVGDIVRLIDDHSYGGLNQYQTGVITDIDNDNHTFTINSTPGAVADERYWELVPKADDLSNYIGRYLQVLADGPNCASSSVKKGDYGLIINPYTADFSNYKNYDCRNALRKHNFNKYRLMPKGFVLPVTKSDVFPVGSYCYRDGYIFKKVEEHPYKCNNYALNIEKKTFYNGDARMESYNSKPVRLATSEEELWLDTCIVAGEFVKNPAKFIPEYYEYTAANSELFIKGKIYKTIKPFNSACCFIDETGEENAVARCYYIKTTKEAYEAQEKLVKEWKPKIGDWIIRLTPNEGITVDKAYKIVGTLTYDTDRIYIHNDKGVKDWYSITTFRKAEPHEIPKECETPSGVKEWAPGTYAVGIKGNFGIFSGHNCRVEVGKVYTIGQICLEDKNLIAIKESTYWVYKHNLKWFPTKLAAEAFSEDLLESKDPPEDFTGCFIEALRNNIACTGIKKGEVVKIKSFSDGRYELDAFNDVPAGMVITHPLNTAQWKIVNDHSKFIGCHIKALVDNPEGTNAQKGEIVKILDFAPLPNNSLYARITRPSMSTHVRYVGLPLDTNNWKIVDQPQDSYKEETYSVTKNNSIKEHKKMSIEPVHSIDIKLRTKKNINKLKF